eukprot:CAMPEP_0181315414 /NCGR_PEP_ID=MMETSP1101-20121128/15366_1 /TAXON_ID=46948 /ORGANISM="Rhodomonas abbreviata, Strain Caron Lab Isolate" /LENGTH=50 /DNA_ID=CAMNT_0023422627 /DNA_START=286 /DNA_END=438 /DNA_ORIENTATION=-
MKGRQTSNTAIAGGFTNSASGEPLAWKRRYAMTKNDSLKRQRKKRTAWLV